MKELLETLVQFVFYLLLMRTRERCGHACEQIIWRKALLSVAQALGAFDT